MAETLLTVEHLIKKYGDQVILDDVSLDVKKGEVIVVVGPSGCGKSTLLRCINALEPIQGGVVKLGDEVIDPKSKSLTRLRQKIGMVFQSYDLFPHLTVLDNILLAPTKVQKRSKDEVKEEAKKPEVIQESFPEDRSSELQLSVHCACTRKSYFSMK